MLNLHAAIYSALKLENIFQDMRQKSEGDYIFGKAFIADAIIEITEKLDSLIFHMNSLSGGNDVELFYKFDKLKNHMNKSFDKSDDGKAPAPKGEKAAISLPDLLKEITEFSTRISFTEENLLSLTHEDIETVHDLLIFCYKRIFDIMDGRFQSLIPAGGSISGSASPVIRIPISYLLQDGEPLFEDELAGRNIPDTLYANPGALKLSEGIQEVFDSEFYASFLKQSYREIDTHGVLLYSNEILSLYYTSGRFNNMVTANICDAVGGNYINLLVSSASSDNPSDLSHRLFEKLLDWLDFYSFSGYGFTIASIGELTRYDMENQLNILGKLLAFVTYTVISPVDEESVQKNIEVFLENIV
jgi:hypothetical protein